MYVFSQGAAGGNFSLGYVHYSEITAIESQLKHSVQKE